MELAFSLMILIRNYDLNYLIYLLLITVFSDTFAYLTGSLYLERRLLLLRLVRKRQ